MASPPQRGCRQAHQGEAKRVPRTLHANGPGPDAKLNEPDDARRLAPELTLAADPVDLRELAKVRH